MKSVMVNVLVQVVVMNVDTKSDYGAKEIATDFVEALVEQGFGHEDDAEYSIIQNNVIWVTDQENVS